MTPMTDANATVRLERIILAPPDQVYRAWLEPDLLVRWLAPGGLEVDRVDVDERVGGHFRIWQTAAGSAAGGFDCELIELVPDRRLVFRWGFVGPERNDGPRFDSLLTITLAEAPEGATRLTLLHEQLEQLQAAMPQVAEQVGVGWDLALAMLATTIPSDGK
jgi:uncharacterized protein YndB with AHSA1/START domain